MNYLAHALLSGPDDELRLGNFLGDFVKGRIEKYHGPYVTERLRDGLRLHRLIDSFTDQHPVVRRSKTRLSSQYGLLSGVIVDLTYDHFLAKRWTHFGKGSLNEFSDNFFTLLKVNTHRYDVAIQPLVQAMTSGNWLVSYAEIEGLERALVGMARRFSVAASIGTAGEVVQMHYDEFGADFEEFFPAISEFCKAYW